MKSFEQLIAKRDFIISKRVSCGNKALYIDDENKMWTMYGSSMVKAKRFSYSEIIDFELIKNTCTHVSSRLGSTIIGAIIAGPVGALAGSAGKRKQTEYVESITLRVKVNNIDVPIVSLEFKDFDKEEKSERAFGLFSYMKENA